MKKKVMIISFFLAAVFIFGFFTGCGRFVGAESYESIMINSLLELERLPQIISAERVTEAQILEAHEWYPYSWFSRQYQYGDFSNLVVYEIIYETADGAQVLGFIVAPADYLENEYQYPVLIRNRGLVNLQGAAPPFAANRLIVRGVPFANAGYITMLTFHRDGRVHVEGEKYDQIGGDDLYDIIALMDLSEHFGFKAPGLFMAGESLGGMKTLMILKEDERIDGAVVFAAMGDFEEYYLSQIALGGNAAWQMGRLAAAIGGNLDEAPEKYIARSAVNWADEIDTPLLLIHGSLDDTVPVSHSKRIYDKMRAAGRDVELKIYEDLGHSVFYYEGAIEYAIDWLRSR
ncbi:MAG: prolyl oligopeptidase family serine peptidase [Defluviitaleaceae bacterium]|nr:prolyl oligopeptidase family serine peptidase [Defluviitaleaceae bacterium]